MKYFYDWCEEEKNLIEKSYVENRLKEILYLKNVDIIKKYLKIFLKLKGY